MGERQIISPRDSLEKSFFFTAGQAISELTHNEASQELGDGTVEDIYIWASSCPDEVRPNDDGIVRSFRPVGFLKIGCDSEGVYIHQHCVYDIQINLWTYKLVLPLAITQM